MFDLLATRRLSTHVTLAILACLLGVLGFGTILANALAEITDAPAARMLIDAGLAQYDYALRYQGIYVRRTADDWESIEQAGRYSNRTTATETLPSGERKQYVFLHKTPLALVAEVATEMSKHDPRRRLRIITTAAEESAQRPDAFEALALGTLAKTGAVEYTGVDGDAAHRVVRLISPPGSPPIWLSASVPHMTPSLLWSLLPSYVWFAGGVVSGLVALFIWAGRHFVVRRVEKLSEFAQSLAAADADVALDPPNFHPDEGTSANELHRQAFALKAVYESLMAALRLLKHPHSH